MDHAGTVSRPLDMDRSLELEGLEADGPAPPLPTMAARDQLVLARLHGQPLAILHLAQPPGDETREELMRAAWGAGTAEIIEHVSTWGCLPAPQGPEHLAELLEAHSGQCPGSVPARPTGRAAVILCTTGADQATLRRSLHSLTRVDDPDFEIVVVDNRPARGETRSLVEGFDSPVPIRWVPEPRPGLARARNSGLAAAAEAAFVAFTDDDVMADAGWLAWLLEPFSEPEVQAVTGLVMPLHLNSPAEKRFEHYAGFGKGVHPQVYDMAEHAAPDRFLYPYWGGMFGSGNSMAFRRSALDAVGGFDPALGAGTATAGGEDLAAFTDIILAGGQLSYQPRAVCWHEHRGDEQALRDQVRNYGVGLTAVFFRYLMTDPRFTLTAIRSLPAIARLTRSRSEDRGEDRLPADLARLELAGRLRGPWRYLVSRRGARRAAGAIDRSSADRPLATQAGAQTRT
jgi:GT2 family glycosyltransferase